MNLLRLFVVFLVVTLACGAFGAAIGGLFGVGASGPVGVYGAGYETEPADVGGDETSEKVRGVEVGVGRPDGTTNAGRGAAIGAGFGLMIGGILGFLVALVDQVVLVIGTGVRRRSGTAEGSS